MTFFTDLTPWRCAVFALALAACRPSTPDPEAGCPTGSRCADVATTDTQTAVETGTTDAELDAAADITVAIDAAGDAADDVPVTDSGPVISDVAIADTRVSDGGEADAADSATGWRVGEVLPEFSLRDENINSTSSGRMVSPRDHLGAVSAWYFGHAT